jgi:hypothetical protein
MDLAHSVEALVEGSDMSELQEGAISIVLEKFMLNVSGCREVYRHRESMAHSRGTHHAIREQARWWNCRSALHQKAHVVLRDCARFLGRR